MHQLVQLDGAVGNAAPRQLLKESGTTELRTFRLPHSVSGNAADLALGQRLIEAWRSDGIFQIETATELAGKAERAFRASKRFFQMPIEQKSRCVSDLTYSGYIASGEEITAGENDYSEIYTVTPDIGLNDWRVKAQWPCHGPAPWPDEDYRESMTTFMTGLGEMGEKLLQLVAFGLGLTDVTALTRLTRDGWHHMRVLRFPTVSSKSARGIGAHTDYGLLVIAAQDDVGGLYIRPAVPGEKRNRNWLPTESMAGMYQNEEPWTFVKPVPNVLTVFPGDILQFLTGGYLLSTPHQVRLNTRERYALAYFHEPNFDVTVRPLNDPSSEERIHYGTHFTNMFMRCYPERITTRRIVENGLLDRFLETRAEG